MKKTFVFAAVLLLGVLLAACGTGAADDDTQEVRLGYFPNLDHAAGIIGIQNGYFEEALGEDYNLNTRDFPDGNTFITALDSGELDIGYVGPGPAINYFLRGQDIVILSGAANGATLIVAREGSGIETLEDMGELGASFCTPGDGCTHNVQLEEMLLDLDLVTDRQGGPVQHVPRQPPASYPSLFETGQVDVAAAPEPWGTYLVELGLGNVLVEWDDVVWGETLSSVVLVSTREYVEENPEVVKKVLEGHVQSVEYTETNVSDTLHAVNDHLEEVTENRLPDEVLENAWERMNVSYEIFGDTLQEWADSSYRLNFIEDDPNLDGFVDTTILDEVLAEQ